ncbi:hypothetical protein D9M68_911850 [compost metagenome]
MRLAVGLHLGDIVGVRSRIEFRGKVRNVVFVVAKHGFDAARKKLLARAQVPIPHPVTRALQRQPPQGLIGTQGRLGLLARRDVEQHAHAQRAFFAGRNRVGTSIHPLHAPIRQHDAELATQIDRPLADFLEVLLQQ